MLKLQHFGHLIKRTNLPEKTLMLGKSEGKKRRKWERMRWLDSISDSMDMNLSKLWKTVKNREAWHAGVHRVSKSQTRLSYWTTATTKGQKEKSKEKLLREVHRERWAQIQRSQLSRKWFWLSRKNKKKKKNRCDERKMRALTTWQPWKVGGDGRADEPPCLSGHDPETRVPA